MWDLSHGFRDKSWNKAPFTLRRLNWWRKVSGWQLASFSLNLSSLGHKWSPILYHHPRKPLSEPPSPPLRAALICWPTETESNSRRTIPTHLREHPLTPSFPLKSQVLLHKSDPQTTTYAIETGLHLFILLPQPVIEARASWTGGKHSPNWVTPSAHYPSQHSPAFPGWGHRWSIILSLGLQSSHLLHLHWKTPDTAHSGS